MATIKKYNGSTWENAVVRKYGTASEIIVPPTTIYADGSNITTYSIKGNTVQNGTPTPSNPVSVNGVGERTANLYNYQTVAIGKYIDANGVEQTSGSTGHQILNHTAPISIIAGSTYAFKIKKEVGYSAMSNAFCWFDSSNQLLYRDVRGDIGSGEEYIEMSYTAPSNAAYLIINFRDTYYDTGMLNTGSTAQSYEPYGYKIPISSGGENLFNPNSTRYHMGKGSNNRIGSVANGAMFYIKAAPNTDYTIKIYTTDSTFVRLYLSNAPIVENVGESYNVISESETTINPEVTISNTNYTYLWIQAGGTWYTEHGGSSIMLNTGSIPLPYEPYNRTTTPIYLGEAQTERKIKKLVLDGTENWSLYDSGDNRFFYTSIADSITRESSLPCTHGFTVMSIAGSGNYIIRIYDSNSLYPTKDDFTDFLADQYAAGTPVTVYYVLATPTTGVVNEPLQKIGNYSDSISNAAAIPTTDGANNITVDTTVQPSEFTATWTGWHDSSVKEKSENLFDKDNTTIENGYLYDTGTSFSWTSASDSRSVRIACETNTQYTLSVTTVLPIFRIGLSDDSNPSPRGITCTKVVNGSNINQYTFTTGASDKYIIFQGTGSMADTWISELMLVEGSTAPSQYEPYWK